MNVRKNLCLSMTLLTLMLLFCACGSSGKDGAVPQEKKQENAPGESPFPKEETDHAGPKRDSTPVVLTPAMDGEEILENKYARVDISHTSQGYVVVETPVKGKVKMLGPSEMKYTCPLSEDGEPVVVPLSDGDGEYTLQVLEHIEGDSYVVDMTESFSVALDDEFLPYLYPNHYVDFAADSLVVQKGAELAEETWSDLEVVEKVYNYLTENIAYDTAKAESVEYGYTPQCDEILEAGTGICFDYASVMTAMLRSQRIPTKLQVGYSGEAYHAWISTYVDDIGWVDNAISFNGESWVLMDPTLAANNSSDAVVEYIGDGSNYKVTHNY